LPRPLNGRVPPIDQHELDPSWESFHCNPSKTKVFTPQAIDTQALFWEKSMKSEPNVTRCRLSWHRAKLLDDKRQDDAPPPTIFSGANKKWKG